MSDFDLGGGDLGDLGGGDLGDLEDFEAEGEEDVVGEPLVMVITEGDDLVCEECEELDGMVFPESQCPVPLHGNCRCIVEPVVIDADNGPDLYGSVMQAWMDVGFSYGGLLGQTLFGLAAGILFWLPAAISYGISESLKGE